MRRWTQAEALAALLEWRYERGTLPKSTEWPVETPTRPGRGAVQRLFGSWGAFIVAGGYEPTKKYRSVEQYRRQAGAATRTTSGVR